MPDQPTRSTTIYINTQRRDWPKRDISYEDLVAIVFPGQTIPEADTVTVQYSRGHDGHGTGTLVTGHSVPVKEGMVFNVDRTTQS